MKKIITLLVALVTLFCFTGVALAGGKATRTWISTSCYDAFYTYSISKGSGVWDAFTISPTTITYIPTNNYTKQLFARPYSSTGHVMGEQLLCRQGGQYTVTCTSHETDTNMKFRIENYYGPGGPVMVSEGSFYGIYT